MIRRTLTAATAAAAVALTVSASAQNFSIPPGARAEPPDPNVPIYFEAASIKQNKEGGGGMGINRAPGGRFTTRNVPVINMIQFSYQLQGYQVVADKMPDWIRNDRWDIVAKLDSDPPFVNPAAGPDHMMLAMRTFLADRFKLKFRREPREMDIYQLVMARPGGKPGPALKPSTDECGQQGVGREVDRAAAQQAGPPRRADGTIIFCGFRQAPGRFELNGMSMALFATGISQRVGRQVVDRTGLTGEWAFTMTFAPPAGTPPPPGVDVPLPDPGAPDLFTAIQEQLGLKLEAAKGPVDVFIIESIERPTED
jgi:uncharacterized protein (TIGR03435 family)